MRLSTISIVIPTLNVATKLTACLKSVQNQTYPKRNIEILVIDAGSQDATPAVAKKFGVRFLHNPLKTGEAGKMVGLRQAKNELVFFLDSDNVLESSVFLQKMVVPFVDRQIVAAEPVRFTYVKNDTLVNRYCALLGMNDPMCLFLGTYDKYSHLTGAWHEVGLEEKQEDGYIKLRAKGKKFITMGANGFMVRRGSLSPYRKLKYYFDVDVAGDLSVGRRKHMAKVDVGIIHLYCRSWREFAKKQARRAGDYFHFRQLRAVEIRAVSSDADINIQGLTAFVVSTVLFFPLLAQAIRGYLNKADSAWFFHIPACYITLWVYTVAVVKHIVLKDNVIDRSRW